MKKIIIACFCVATLGLITGCGTVNGFGKDVSHAGHDIQKAAR